MNISWKSRVARPLVTLGAALLASPLLADLARDANTTRIIGEEGNWVMENAVQLERDPDGKTWTYELAIQYAPAARLQLLLEPTLWERDEPDDGPAVDGLGDTDFTVACLAIPERGAWPALVVAGKIKVPTADNREIGTGKADYSAATIIGKEYGELDVSLELEYETFGDPPLEPPEPELAPEAGEADEDAGPPEEPLASEDELELKDQFIYTLSADYGLTENLSLYVEAFGNTKPSKEEKASNAIGAGLEYDIELTDLVNPFVTVGYDTDELFTAKIGIESNW